jgi:hypothetical protein
VVRDGSAAQFGLSVYELKTLASLPKLPGSLLVRRFVLGPLFAKYFSNHGRTDGLPMAHVLAAGTV